MRQVLKHCKKLNDVENCTSFSFRQDKYWNTVENCTMRQASRACRIVLGDFGYTASQDSRAALSTKCPRLYPRNRWSHGSANARIDVEYPNRSAPLHTLKPHELLEARLYENPTRCNACCLPRWRHCITSCSADRVPRWRHQMSVTSSNVRQPVWHVGWLFWQTDAAAV